MNEENSQSQRIHPLRRWWVWVLVIVGLLVLILLLSVFIYNYQAEKAFERHQSELVALGETLKIGDLVPPKIADSVNFAKSNIVSAWSAAEEGVPDNYAQLRTDLIPGIVRPSTMQVRYTWSTFLHENFNNLTESEAADTVLDYCSLYSDELNELSVAAKRPNCNFKRDYSKDLFPALPEAYPLQKAAMLLKIRALAYLETDNPESAADDVLTILRMGCHYRDDPGMLQQMFAVSMCTAACTVVCHGLHAKQWNAESLDNLSSHWPECQLQAGLLRAARMERALFVKTLIDSPSRIRPPKGLLYENATLYSTLVQEEFLTNVSGSRLVDRVRLDGALHARTISLSRNRISQIRYTLARKAILTWRKIPMKVVRVETFETHALIAIELELFRYNSGKYPKSLTEISAKRVTDPFTGLPCLYERFENGAYLLYSVGPDGFDDGGLLRHDIEEGDWVWLLNLPDDFDYKTFRR